MNSETKTVNRFISGGRELRKAASADADAMRKANGFAAAVIVLVTVIVSLSVSFAAHILVRTIGHEFGSGMIALASVALVCDFADMLVISAGFGTVMFLYARGSVGIGDIPKAALSMLPLTATVTFAVGACAFSLACFDGSIRFVIAGVIASVAFGEIRRYLYFPAVIALTMCDMRSARIISAKMAHADRDILSADMRRTVFTALFSVVTFLIGAVFALPKLTARITADAAAILPDYEYLLSYTKTKEGEKKWQKKKSSI